MDRTFLFSGLNLGQVPGRADRNCGKWIALFFSGLNLGCQAELTEIVESGSHFFFVSGKCLAELTEIVESGSHFSFFSGLNLGQVPGRVHRNCGEWIALFFGI